MHADIQGVARIADELIPRGWTFDQDHSSAKLVTWYYPPSGAEVDDESLEAVTRIWLTDPEAPYVLLVGSAGDPASMGFTVEELFGPAGRHRVPPLRRPVSRRRQLTFHHLKSRIANSLRNDAVS